MRVEDLADVNATAEPMIGRFRTAPADRRDVAFVWSGDTAGQGWGIDESRGGMTIYATMAKHRPDFFIHSGDTIYADGPIAAEVKLPDGSVYDITTDEKAKVAETPAEFRAATTNTISSTAICAPSTPRCPCWRSGTTTRSPTTGPREVPAADKRYTERAVPPSPPGGAGLHEYMPIAATPEAGRVYRKVAYGPLLDVFFIDMRYRGPNTTTSRPWKARRPSSSAQQLAWLKRGLHNSRAT